MILAIDAGNTNIVIGCIENDKILFAERFATNTSITSLQYAIEFKGLLELKKINISDVTGCIISSVVPQINLVLKESIELILNKTPLFIEHGIKTGLNIKIENPAQIGADLIVDSVGAIHLYKAPLIIIDMGTATTITVVDKNNDFIGGMIIPGVNVSLNSLVSKTAALPKIAIEPTKNIIGRNTIDCMKSGIVYSQACAIDGIIDRIFDELACEAKVIATGGIAKCIIPNCKHKIIINENLILEGLNIIYKKNCKQTT